MSGLLALLDDVAGIAKVAAASIDDVAAQALKSGSKAAGAVIDDAAVTPKYVQGFAPARELPIVWRIARGSIINKLLFLLPAGLALSAFLPQAIPILLIIGGCYLCFEGAEKLVHTIGHHEAHDETENFGDAAHLEEQRVRGAIKTDFILSAEIMTIALAAIPESNFWFEAATLAFVAVGITVAVYGSVALIVKADDVGLAMARGGLAPIRAVGRGIVRGMPYVMKTLSVVGTAAMLWVGGSIIVHSVKDLGFKLPYTTIHDMALSVAALGSENLQGFLEWATTAALDGVLGVCVGLALIPLGTKVITPMWQAVFKGRA